MVFKFNKATFSALVCALACNAQAAPGDATALPAAKVEGVQLPAWVERANGSKFPLSPGLSLGSQDKVITGQNARLLLRLADGSTIKLGEQAQLKFNNAEATRKNEEVTLRAALNVVVGAFRFTTDALNKLRSKREVDIRISTVTAGIRGTDLWGAQRPDREIVCLIEGKISVDRALNNSTESVTLDQPMQFYVALKDKPANPVGNVSLEQLGLWSLETEYEVDAPVISSTGPYKVVFLETESTREAFKVFDALRAAGYPATVVPKPGKTQHSYVVQLTGLESDEAANALLERLPQYDKARVER
jgi:hypothetical protein